MRAIAQYKIRQVGSSVPMSDSIQQEARQILDPLAFGQSRVDPVPANFEIVITALQRSIPPES